MRWTVLLLAVAKIATAQQPRPILPDTATVVANPFVQLPQIPIKTGDTLFFHFSVWSDTVSKIKVVNTTNVVASGCGLSYFIVRSYKRAGRDSILTGVSWAPLLAAATSCDTAVASLSLFDGLKLDSLGNVVGTTSSTMQQGTTRCIYVEARSLGGRVLTGKPFTLHSSDTTVVALGGTLPAGAPPCPDTTVNIAGMRAWITP